MFASKLSDLSDVPQHMIESMERNLWGAILCLGGGLLLLIVAIIMIGLARRKSNRNPFDR